MKTIICTIIAIALTLGEVTYSYKGTTDTRVAGKQVFQDNLILEVTESGEGLSFYLGGFEIFGYKGLSIKGIFKVNDQGDITGWSNIVIKGAPTKVKTLEGSLNGDRADIHMAGKAAGVFAFDVRYKAKRQF